MYPGKSLIDFILFLLYLRKPVSQTTGGERKVIAKYANKKNRAVEIGVFQGLNTCIIAKSLEKNGRLYGIDPFFKGRLGISYHQLVARIYLKRNQQTKKVKLLEMFSKEAIKFIPDQIDFLFIDGDHSFEGIKSDWELYSPKIEVNGIVALHDTRLYDRNKKNDQMGSYQYFRNFIQTDKKFEIIDEIDSLHILKRVK